MIKKRFLFILVLCLIFIVPNVSADSVSDTYGDNYCVWSYSPAHYCTKLGTMYENDVLSISLDHDEYDQICEDISMTGHQVGGYIYPTWTANSGFNPIENSGYIGGFPASELDTGTPANWTGYTYSGTRFSRNDTRLEIRIDCSGGGDTSYGWYELSQGEPSVWTNYTIITKNLADEAVANIDVEILTDIGTYTGTTNSTGYAVIAIEYLSTNAEVTTTANTIYDAYSEFFSITPLGNNTLYLTAKDDDAVYINYEYTVVDETESPIIGAYIEHTISPNFVISGVTDNNGTLWFGNVPTYNELINVKVTKSGYNDYIDYIPIIGTPTDVGIDIDMTHLGITPTPTPTPTPIQSSNVILTVYPNSINLGDTVSLTTSAQNNAILTYAGGLRQVLYFRNKNNPNQPYNYEMIGAYYAVNSTHWKFRASNSVPYGTPSSSLNPKVLTHTPDSGGIYTYGVSVYGDNSQALAPMAFADVLIGGGAGGGALIMNLFAYDGSNTNHLSNYQMNITDDNSGVVTEFGNISYDKDVSLLRGNPYTLTASKENYETDSKSFVVPVSADIEQGDFGAMVGVPLFPIGVLSAGNTTVTVHVTDIETYYPIGNVQIQMSIDGSSKYTGTSGESVYWVIPQNTPYTVKAIKNGYCSVTESKNTGTNDYQYVPLFMKYGSCTGTTPTPTPTPTPSVTITPIGNWTGNIGGAIVCGNLPQNATMVDVLKNSLACNGLEDQASQNLGLACLIILFCAIILGRVAKGVGVLSGVIAGTVLATVAGFLPFWIIIVVVIMAGLIFAAKVFWTPGG